MSRCERDKAALACPDMRIIFFPLGLALWLLASCGDVARNGTSPDLSSALTTSDKKKLALQHWNLQSEPKNVLIALHGLQGASRDYRENR